MSAQLIATDAHVNLDLLARSYDLAMLRTASLFDLTSKEGRDASNAWLVDLFTGLTAAVRPHVVLELGAYGADFSVSARASLPKAEVHAFEANPYNIAKFGKRVRRAGVEYHHFAIGDRVGATVFNVARKEAGQELRPARGNNSLRTKPIDIEYEEVQVPMVTVDHFLAERGLAGRPTVMWIDLEGCAFEALLGAAATLEHTQLIFIEVEDHPFWNGQKLSAEVLRQLVGAGFMPLARDFETRRQYNLILAKPQVLDHMIVRLALADSFAELGQRARRPGPV